MINNHNTELLHEIHSATTYVHLILKDAAYTYVASNYWNCSNTCMNVLQNLIIFILKCMIN